MYIDRNYIRKAVLLLPIELRTPLTIALVSIIGNEFQMVYSRLQGRYNDLRYKLNNTSQVLYLGKVLNDAIDPALRRIEIRNTALSSTPVVRLYDREFETPLVLGTIILHDRSYYGVGDYDFQIIVPQLDELNTNNMNMLNAIVKYYKLAGKRALLTKEEIIN